MTHGSLFAGIGGFDLGFERAGIETLWQVEIDPFCRRVLEKHWPDVQRFTDIRECRELPAVDIISGGFPCQPHSLAGDRRGTSDERWLWPEFQRIICDIRPRFIVVENVPGLLTSAFGEVIGGLAEVGYDCEWECISARAFGAEHIRDRVWIIAYPHTTRSQIWGQAGTNKAHEGVFGSGLGFTFGTPAAGLECCGAARWSGDVHGIPKRVDRVKALGNSIVPQIAEWIGRRIVEAERRGNHD